MENIYSLRGLCDHDLVDGFFHHEAGRIPGFEGLLQTGN
jgi:hypothetical protein